MMKFFVMLILTLLMGCAAQKSRVSKDWRKDSDKIGKAFANALAVMEPEELSIIGLEKFDAAVTPFSKTYDQEKYVLAYKWNEKFKRFLAVEKNPELRADIEILQEVTSLRMEEYEVTKKAGIVPFMPLTQFVHNTLKYFFIKFTPRYKTISALTRFRKYVRGDDKTLPLVDGYTSWMLARMKYLEENKKRGFWPTKAELDNYFENSDKYIEGIEKFLSTWENDDWKRDLEELKIQDKEFRNFLKKKVYPYARSTNVMPENVYAFKLKTNGIYYTPKQLIETATADYNKTYVEFKKLAAKIGNKLNLSDVSPAGVIGFLRIHKASNDKELMDMYSAARMNIFEIIKQNRILTLPKPPEYVLRYANAIEAEVTPNPQFQGRPLLIKTNLPSQVILPRVEDSHGMDDYNYKEAVISLTVHEAIPGHALQFDRIVESGTTLARAHFALTNANVEGWGLYSEDMIFPYVEDEVKLVFYQRLLWRQARMFLDPQLNLGLINRERVIQLLTKELGFSEGLAISEYRRYSYISPAQAPSYYYGKKMILETKARVQAKPDTIFDERCFNDAVLNSGILPLKMINDRLVRDLNCVH